jgi:hypothetical protein
MDRFASESGVALRFMPQSKTYGCGDSRVGLHSLPWLRSILPAVLAFFACAAPVRAAVITLAPVADTSLIEVAPTNNHGGQAWVNSGTTQNGPRTRGLFQFDLSVIPTNAIVLSAELVLSVTGQPVEPANAPFGLYRMLQPWGEGDKSADAPPGYGQGLPAEPGEATWMHSFFPTNAWSAPGGAPGVDFWAFASAFQFIYDIGESPYTFESTPELVEDVQGWVSDPQSNFGWMLLCDDETTRFTARRFASREDLDNAPALQIEYVIPPRIDSVERVGSELGFSFVAHAGQNYSIEFRDVLSGNAWQVLTNIAAAGEIRQMLILDALSSTQRFYRIAAQ